MVSRETAEKTIEIYKNAWINQDSKEILTIFTKNATYYERAFEKPFSGHKEIKEYWNKKVVQEQSDIKFRLLNIYIQKDIVVAEWEASFFNNAENQRTQIREVAILEFESNKIKSLREYWHSKHS